MPWTAQDITLWVGQNPEDAGRPVVLPLSSLEVREADATLFQRIGITRALQPAPTWARSWTAAPRRLPVSWPATGSKR